MAFEAIAWLPIGLPGPRADHSGGPPAVNVPLLASSRVGHPLRAAASALKPDLVILDVKMPVLDGISAAERIAAQQIAPVVILTAFSQRELVERARDAGAMAYLVKPFTKADLVPAIEIAVSRFQEMSALGTELGTLRERLEARKVLDRAKGRLQSESGLSEPEAFRWIQKTSMNRRVTMRAVAEAVLAGELPENPAGGGGTAGGDGR